MTEKVQVNKVVAGWIDEAKRYFRNSTTKEHRINKLMLQFILKETGSTDFINQNIDIVTLAKAIQYGYEVPYEFKVGDIVAYGSTGVVCTITENGEGEMVGTRTTLERMNKNGLENYKLICKSENREDLKK